LRDEDRFPTVRFQKCKACGHVYTGSLSGENECPSCHAHAEPQIPAGGRFQHEFSGLHSLFTITGTVYKIQELEEFKSQIDGVLAQDPESIAFEFRKSSYLNSSMINLLVKTMQTLSVKGKPTFIISDETEVVESLAMMDLDRVMRIVPTLEKYRAALG
jgi:anti-anti-sigma regulatory factor